MALRRFLYLSPYFPPHTRVGALRPLKFVRHLPAFGWAPVVISDAQVDGHQDPKLVELVPSSTEVYRTWSHPTVPSLERWLRARWPSDDVLPLSHHRLDLRSGERAAKAALRAHPECRAIVVNADPFAALLVGARLSKATGLPLIQDLRDPWSPCELRRPHRDRLRQAWITRLERQALGPASAIVLNTETARDDYRRAFPEIPQDRFHVIRNHADDSITRQGQQPRFDHFTALFLGNFRRFVTGETLLAAMARLGPEQALDLVVTGSFPDAMRAQLHRLGLDERVHALPSVPFVETGPWMAAADLLVSVSHRVQQRIPAKIYEYASSPTPILALHDNPELSRMLDGLAGAESAGLDDVEEVTTALRRALARGRSQKFERRGHGLDSATAAGCLASLLDAVSEGAT